MQPGAMSYAIVIGTRGKVTRMKLYYAAHTCALASHIALEEAGADYSTVRIDFAANEQRRPEYLAINPKGRVPALVTDRGILTETPAMLAFIAQSFPQACLAPLDDPFAFARVQAFNSYLCSTVHVAHAHRMRSYRWADNPAAIQVMAAFTDNFTRLCLAAPHISVRAPALREVISFIRILGQRTSKRIQDDGQVLNGQTHAHGAEHHSGGQRVLEVFIDAAQRCARIIVVKDHEGLPLMVVVQPGFDFLDSVRSPQPARRFPLLVEADSNETDVGGPKDAFDLLTGEHLSPG